MKKSDQELKKALEDAVRLLNDNGVDCTMIDLWSAVTEDYRNGLPDAKTLIRDIKRFTRELLEAKKQEEEFDDLLEEDAIDEPIDEF